MWFMMTLISKRPFRGFRWDGYRTKDSDSIVEQGAARYTMTHFNGIEQINLVLCDSSIVVPLDCWVIIYPDGAIHCLYNSDACKIFTKEEKL